MPYFFFRRFPFGGDIGRVVEVRMTGSMGTLVLVLTFRAPVLVRLVVREVLIRMAPLLPHLVSDGVYPLVAGLEPAAQGRLRG